MRCTGEAGLHGIVGGAGVRIGAIGMTRGLGVILKGALRTGSSLATGIVARRRLGKDRPRHVTRSGLGRHRPPASSCARTPLRRNHVDVRNMWTRAVVRAGRTAIARITGGENAADKLAQHLGGPAAARRMKRLRRAVESGRRNTAPVETDLN